MKRWFTLFAAVLIAGTTAVATADAQVSTSDEPPLIAGRVALAEGDAQIWRTEEDNAGQWDAAMVNDVVSVGTGLYTGNDGRNEVRDRSEHRPPRTRQPRRLQPARLRDRRLQPRIRHGEPEPRATRAR